MRESRTLGSVRAKAERLSYSTIPSRQDAEAQLSIPQDIEPQKSRSGFFVECLLTPIRRRVAPQEPPPLTSRYEPMFLGNMQHAAWRMLVIRLNCLSPKLPRAKDDAENG